MYISLLKGTKKPKQKIKGQGEQGPVIGPIYVSWTYDNVKLHDPHWDDFEPLTISKVNGRQFIHFDGCYYAEFKIWNDNHPSVALEQEKGRTFISWKEFLQKMKRPARFIEDFEPSYDTDPEDELKDTNYKNMYIALSHGRKNPKAEMEGWGDAGPILGPVNISWINGKFRLHDPKSNTFYRLPSKDGLIPIKDRMFYGDFEIWHPNDPLIKGNRKDKRRFINWNQFRKLIA